MIDLTPFIPLSLKERGRMYSKRATALLNSRLEGKSDFGDSVSWLMLTAEDSERFTR